MKPRKKRRTAKRRKQPLRKKPSTSQRSRSPVNLRKAKSVPDDSGFLIIRLKPGVVSKDARTLDEVAEQFKLSKLATLLKKYKSPSQPLITSVSVEQLRKLEERGRERARDRKFTPGHSLASYWRLDCRAIPEAELRAVLNQCRELQDEVDFAYLEQAASAPASVTPNFELEQHYLDPAPTGIDARWAWTQGFNGSGVHFVDLEEGWFLGHEDLPGGIQLICNDVSASDGLRDHGTAVLGVITASNNNLGIIGIAPGALVSVASHFKRAGGTNGHVADAIKAAVEANPPPHVILLEVQRGTPELPTESDPADFEAIQDAVEKGVIVIEAAGNGGIDLDSWVDDHGLNRLNRASTDFQDSGAILVGAAFSSPPHNRFNLEPGASNFGSRVDCYAWGDNIVSTGYGDRNPETQDNNRRYTKRFGCTSGASAIIAGAALLVQEWNVRNKGTLMLPEEMRKILSNPRTGTRRGRQVSGHIGVMPDLRSIII